MYPSILCHRFSCTWESWEVCGDFPLESVIKTVEMISCCAQHDTFAKSFDIMGLDWN